ncbi:hypothetical protein A2U01_0070821, partial [Trifolium medium]|nr:hypothetical protein [Trifolium medium]
MGVKQPQRGKKVARKDEPHRTTTYQAYIRARKFGFEGDVNGGCCENS